VGKKAGTVLLQLTETRKTQSEKLEAKLAGRKGLDKVEVGESVVNDTKEAIGRITDGMTEYQTKTSQTAEDARAIAKAIRGNAESLERGLDRSEPEPQSRLQGGVRGRGRRIARLRRP
jgi:hypothetical protein